MKKSSKARLTLHRETLRNLASPDLMAVPGGVNTAPFCRPTYTCNVSCGGTCDYLNCHNTDTSNRC
jgi:hypothetical protein